jgi:hypothetical protein
MTQILWKPKAYYCVYKIPATGSYSEPAESSPHPHTISQSFHFILSLFSHLRLDPTNALFPLLFSTKLPDLKFYAMCFYFTDMFT